MVYCYRCGTLNSDDSSYCLKCGAQIRSKGISNVPHYNATKNINIIVAGVVALVVFAILTVFLINGPYFNLLLFAVPIVGILIAEWSRQQRKRIPN